VSACPLVSSLSTSTSVFSTTATARHATHVGGDVQAEEEGRCCQGSHSRANGLYSPVPRLQNNSSPEGMANMYPFLKRVISEDRGQCADAPKALGSGLIATHLNRPTISDPSGASRGSAASSMAARISALSWSLKVS
jgi:hypothetical protein